MFKLKTGLIVIAKLFRLMAVGVENWPWVLALVCVLSPISPHIRIPYELSYTNCDYIGTRGIIETDDTHCPLIAVLNTKTDEIVSLKSAPSEFAEMLPW